jgi:hypothetical protein
MCGAAATAGELRDDLLLGPVAIGIGHLRLPAHH